MDLLEGRPLRRLPRSPAVAVAAALLLLGAAQAVAVTREQPLPDGVALEVPLELYAFASAAPGVHSVTFQLRNAGRPVRVERISEAVPGLSLVDRVVAGEPVGFREVGAGPAEDVPAFDLDARVVAIVTLTYAATGCFGTPTSELPVDVTVVVDGRRGVVQLPLPTLPDDAADAAPDDAVEWQQVLARRLCG